MRLVKRLVGSDVSDRVVHPVEETPLAGKSGCEEPSRVLVESVRGIRSDFKAVSWKSAMELFTRQRRDE